MAIKKEYQYYGKLIAEATEESDRAVAILLCAELDELLLKIIEKRIVSRNKNQDSPDLLSPMGPLGSFSARIEIAYGLGVIDKIVAHDLHTVRRIRNLFAHRTHGLYFESEKPRNLVQKFKITKFGFPNGSPIIYVDLNKPRNTYQSISFFLIGHLKDLHRQTRRLKEKVSLYSHSESA